MDWGVEGLASRILKNDQPIVSMDCIRGPCVLMCLGQSWFLSFVPAVLLTGLPFVLRNIKVSLTDHKDIVITCDLYMEKCLIALSIVVWVGHSFQ